MNSRSVKVSKPKTIILDAYQYSPHITGTDRMARHFLEGLQACDTANTYYVICSLENYTKSALHQTNFKIIQPPRALKLLPLTRIFLKIWREALCLYFVLHKTDIYLSFHNMRLPRYRLAKKMIVSNLDLVPIVLDEYKGAGRLSYEKQLKYYQEVASKADGFISISEFSKQELSRYLGVAREKIKVISLGVEHSFFSKTNKHQQPAQKYILTIGGSEPRKNVSTVVKAYGELPDKLKDEYHLHVVGGPWQNQDLSVLGQEKNVRLLGVVSDDELKEAYSNAAVFVFASYYEGFGLTILEAWASGTAVISSNAASLSEVAGQEALLFPPNDYKDLSGKIEKVLTDEALLKKLREVGHKQAQKFTWEKASRKLHSFLIKGTL